MPKYLFTGSYTDTGAKGLVKEGGTARRAAVDRLAASVGGTVEAYYWAFGPTDFVAIVDLPDHAAAAAVALTVSGSGTVAVETTVLLTESDLDDARDRSPSYSPPSS